MSELLTRLNMDARLYSPLSECIADADQLDSLSAEEQRIAVSLKLEFERDGIEAGVIDHRAIVSRVRGFRRASRDRKTP